jgi:hypothetical protein
MMLLDYCSYWAVFWGVGHQRSWLYCTLLRYRCRICDENTSVVYYELHYVSRRPGVDWNQNQGRHAKRRPLFPPATEYNCLTRSNFKRVATSIPDPSRPAEAISAYL